jgi:uncharacterized protein involved in exopolysaccharide biosynthesis
MSTSQLEPPATRRPSDLGRSADERVDTELSLLAAVNVVLRRRALVIGTTVLVMVAIGTLTLLGPRTYTSSASFMPQTARNPAGGGGGIAAQLGLSMLTADPTQSPPFYVDLLKSRGILDSTVNTRFRVQTDRGPADATLMDLLKVRGRTPELRREAAILALGRAVKADPSLKTGVVTFSVRASGPDLAKQVADRLLQLLNAFNLRRRRTQASEERRFAEERLNQARSELRVAEDRLQGFLQRNRMYESAPDLRFEEDRLSREVLMRQQLYTSVAQAFEQARMDEVRDTPVITVIEQPNVPARPDPRGLLKWLVVGLLFGLGLGVGLAYLRELMDRSNVEPGSEIDQFHLLWRDTMSDITHPWRLVMPGRRSPERRDERVSTG